MRYCILIVLLFISLPALAQNVGGIPTAGAIDHSQDMLRQDEALRQEIAQEKKFFIDKIDIKGASKLSPNELKDIITPFQGNWLTKKDIQKIMDSLKAAYAKKGTAASHLKMTYELKKSGTLEIKVSELTR